jgi:hypothetical protein
LSRSQKNCSKNAKSAQFVYKLHKLNSGLRQYCGSPGSRYNNGIKIIFLKLVCHNDKYENNEALDGYVAVVVAIYGYHNVNYKAF